VGFEQRGIAVLGIDPGSVATGYGIVMMERGRLKVVAHGEIKPERGAPLSACLTTIYDELLAIVTKTQPDVIAIEDIFYGKNVKSLIKQGHVRGVAILAGAHRRIPIFEYTPLEVKKAVVGYGRAEKGQVQNMVKTILELPVLPSADAADALAVAICHAHSTKALSV
jgi:crossover junction endodeoxyribonuclease RuvC